MAARSIECLETSEGEFELQNWRRDHALHAALKTGCTVEVGKPKIAIRFYLKRAEKLGTCDSSSSYNRTRGWWYNLHADVLEAPGNFAVRVTATKSAREDEEAEDVTQVGIVTGPRCNDVQVIDEFVHMDTEDSDGNSAVTFGKNGLHQYGTAYYAESLKINLEVELFGVKVDETVVASGAQKQAKEYDEALSTNLMNANVKNDIFGDMKTMYTSDEVYGDLKVETKDGIAFNAHKFIVAARSRYLRDKLEKATKEDDFKGVLQVHEANGKSMKVILHWLYTEELHETAADVMEEVAELAILFELNQLLKLLDEKLIGICTKQNMFRLYTVAQKTAMPTATKDISAFIRENI